MSSHLFMYARHLYIIHNKNEHYGNKNTTNYLSFMKFVDFSKAFETVANTLFNRFSYYQIFEKYPTQKIRFSFFKINWVMHAFSKNELIPIHKKTDFIMWEKMCKLELHLCQIKCTENITINMLS